MNPRLSVAELLHEQDERVVEPGYLTDFWTEHGVRFIEKNRDRPFFLFLAYNGPYGLGKSLLNPARNRHAGYYADKELKFFGQELMELAEAILKLVTNLELAKIMGEYARHLSETRFSWRAVARQIVNVYEQLLEKESA